MFIYLSQESLLSVHVLCNRSKDKNQRMNKKLKVLIRMNNLENEYGGFFMKKNVNANYEIPSSNVI